MALIETGSGTESDLVDALDRLLPRDERWRHRHGSEGHGADHVLPAFVDPSITIPVISGRLALGTWQSVVLVDLNRDNPQRSLRLSFLPADRREHDHLARVDQVGVARADPVAVRLDHHDPVVGDLLVAQVALVR